MDDLERAKEAKKEIDKKIAEIKRTGKTPSLGEINETSFGILDDNGLIQEYANFLQFELAQAQIKGRTSWWRGFRWGAVVAFTLAVLITLV